MTTFFTILRLIERARNTTFFSIDTETADSSGRPAIIQIEFVQVRNNAVDIKEEKTTILIF